MNDKIFLKAAVLISLVFYNLEARAIFDNFFSDPNVPFKTGEFINVVKDRVRPAKILEIKKDNNNYYLRITYVGYSSQSNEWIDIRRANKIH